MYRKAVTEELPKSQFDAARLGFFQLLRRKRMSPQFIDREGEDLFAQACFEYSRQLAEGRRIENPVAWIVTCGWHRTVGLLESRDWRPRIVSTDRVGELGEDDATPEHEFLSEDRYRRVREAVERLPGYQRRLLALSYFEDESVREAARRLNWTPSKAQRAHEAAQRRLHKLLGVETSDELAVEVGLAAFLSVAGGGCSRHLRLIGSIEGAVDAIAHPDRFAEAALELVRRPFGHGTASGELGGGAIERVVHHPGAFVARPGQRLSELGRRLFTTGAAETTAAAAEGGGRTLELCKAIAAVCLISGGAVTGALIEEGHHGAVHPAAHPRTVAVKSQPHRVSPSSRILAEGQLPEPTAKPAAPEASAVASQPAERHQSPEHHQTETTAKKAKPPPSRPEGEFEPSPEATAAEPEPELEPVAESDTEVADAARTTTSTSSSGSTAKPKAVPANSPEEFEP